MKKKERKEKKDLVMRIIFSVIPLPGVTELVYRTARKHTEENIFSAAEAKQAEANKAREATVEVETEA